MSSTLHALFGVDPLRLKGKFTSLNQNEPSNADATPVVANDVVDQDTKATLMAYQWFRDLLMVLPENTPLSFVIAEDIATTSTHLALPDAILTTQEKRKLWMQVQSMFEGD